MIDGTVLPWEVVPSIKVHELVRNHTEIPGSPTFYTATFVLVMNKAKYESLPADLKQVIDANSGMAAATMAGKVWDEQAIAVSTMVRNWATTSLHSPKMKRFAGEWNTARHRELAQDHKGARSRRPEAAGLPSIGHQAA